MPTTRTLLLFALTFALLLPASSCFKEGLVPSYSIERLSAYWDSDPDKKFLFQLRHAFAKTVARAFADREFAEYFKQHFCVAKDNHYEELFFGLHKDDPINASGKTLYQHLAASADEEVRSLFGDNLLDLVLQFDPCVVIKMPDVFRSFNWNTGKVRPAVIAQAPHTYYPWDIFGGDQRFLAYHFAAPPAAVHDQFDFFHVTVKYSEDYLMLDPQSLLNERGISFYEILPQAEDCDNGMRDDIAELGRPHTMHTDKLVIKRMDAFLRWRDKCGYKGKYWSRDPACTDPCKRNCVPLEESVLLVDSFCVFRGRIFELQQNVHLDESHTYSWTFWRKNEPEFLYRITIPSLPHEWFETRNFEVELLARLPNEMPVIRYESSEKDKGRAFPLHAVFKRGVLPDDLFSFSIDVLIYADLKRGQPIWHQNYPRIVETQTSESYHFVTGFTLGCWEQGKVASGETWTLISY